MGRMAFGWKRKTARSPEVEAARQAIEKGWNGLPWGTSLSDFQARFPGATRSDSGWWLTGDGHESFFGIVMLTQYSFNSRDQLCLVAFYPETTDRERLPVVMINALGMPRGQDIGWKLGGVDVDVKAASVAASLTHRKLAAVR